METIKHQAAPHPQRPRPRQSPGPLIAGLGIGALFCLLIAIFLGYFLLTPPSVGAVGPAVTIRAPLMGVSLPVNMPVQAQATAQDDAGVTRLEIYADGALIAAQTSDLPGGQTPIVMLKSWVPLTEGQHLLMARAYPADGGFLDSPLIKINVVERTEWTAKINTGENPTTAREIADVFHMPVEDLLKANPGLPQDPDAEIPPGTDVDIPVPPPEPPAEPPPPPDPAPGTPTAPTGLTVTADCANATLNWTDSPDETSYVVYRLDPPYLTPIATLPADSVTYTDPLPALGTYTYQVASEKDGLQGLSLMASASTPGDCPPVLPPPAAILDLNLVMELLVTDAVWDGVYCYFNFNGTGYQRVPASDFLYMTPEPDGKTYDLSIQLPDSGQFHVTGDTTAGITLSGECWGKLGAEVSLLGSFSATHGPDDWDGETLTQTAMRESSIRLSAPAPVPHRAPNLTLTYHIDQVPDLIEPPFWDLGWLDVIFGLLELPAPTNLRIENSAAGCAEFSGFDAVICQISAAMSGGEPTLLWDWTGNTFHAEEQLTRYLVTLRAHDLSTGIDTTFWSRNIYRAGPGVPIRTAQFLPTEGLPCGSQIVATVQAFKGVQASQQREVVWQTTPACSEMVVTVTFDSFSIDPQAPETAVEDVGEGFCWFCDTSRLELNGSLGVNGLWMVTGNAGGSPLDPCPGLAWCLNPGSYPITSLNVWSIGGGAPAVTFNQPYTDAITVWFGFDEEDAGSAVLDGCGGTQVFVGTNPASWPATINGTHTITMPMTHPEEGQCSLTFTIEGHEAP